MTDRDRDDGILKNYYALRAREYDALYEKNDRQDDLKLMSELVSSSFAGKNVLEIACGTGWWTYVISERAEKMLSTDVNEEMLSVARRRNYGRKNVQFLISDAYRLDNVKGDFDSAFCGYWMSHVKKRNMRKFLVSLHSKIRKGSVVVLLDNLWVARANKPISRRDEEGNTYQTRKLNNGMEFEIVKNFLTGDDLMSITEGIGDRRQFFSFQYYWVFRYVTL